MKIHMQDLNLGIKVNEWLQLLDQTEFYIEHNRTAVMFKTVAYSLSTPADNQIQIFLSFISV